MGYIIHLKKLPSAKPKKPESPGYPPAKLWNNPEENSLIIY